MNEPFFSLSSNLPFLPPCFFFFFSLFLSFVHPQTFFLLRRLEVFGRLFIFLSLFSFSFLPCGVC